MSLVHSSQQLSELLKQNYESYLFTQISYIVKTYTTTAWEPSIHASSGDWSTICRGSNLLNVKGWRSNDPSHHGWIKKMKSTVLNLLNYWPSIPPMCMTSSVNVPPRPGVDFIKVGRKAQIIEIALSKLWARRKARRTPVKSFSKVGRRAQIGRKNFMKSTPGLVCRVLA